MHAFGPHSCRQPDGGPCAPCRLWPDALPCLLLAMAPWLLGAMAATAPSVRPAGRLVV